MWLKFKVASWGETLRVRVHAINGDDRETTGAYIKRLDSDDFRAIEWFINKEASRYGIPVDVVEISFAGQLLEKPPQPPVSGRVLENVLWSLRFRAWAWYQEKTTESFNSDINLYVNYFDLATTQTLQHSVGLRGGLIGLINAFADHDYRGSNNVVIAHELMHIFGASDKYGAASQPLYPDGYADPFQDPVYPQTRAEIMGGRIPLTANRSKMPVSLAAVVVNVFTASEIHWPVQ